MSDNTKDRQLLIDFAEFWNKTTYKYINETQIDIFLSSLPEQQQQKWEEADVCKHDWRSDGASMLTNFWKCNLCGKTAAT